MCVCVCVRAYRAFQFGVSGLKGAGHPNSGVSGFERGIYCNAES